MTLMCHNRAADNTPNEAGSKGGEGGGAVRLESDWAAAAASQAQVH